MSILFTETIGDSITRDVFKDDPNCFYKRYKDSPLQKRINFAVVTLACGNMMLDILNKEGMFLMTKVSKDAARKILFAHKPDARTIDNSQPEIEFPPYPVPSYSKQDDPAFPYLGEGRECKPLNVSQPLPKEFADNFQAVPEKELVHHPAHYGGDTLYEVIKIAEAKLSREEFIGAMKFNVWKYSMRMGKKDDEMLDSEKATFYQNYLNDFMKRTKNER